MPGGGRFSGWPQRASRKPPSSAAPTRRPRKALVGQVRIVKVSGYEGLSDGPLVGGRGGQEEGAYHALGIYHRGHLEAVDPLGLGGAPAEGGLPAEELLASFAGPHPHDGRDERRVPDAVDGRRIAEF